MALLRTCLLLGILLVGLRSAGAQEDFRDLMSRVPPTANAVMVIDVQSVLNSPLAVREGWKDQQAASARQPLVLPPEAERMVLASRMNAAEELHQDWELALLTLSEEFPMRAIARAEGGYVDEIEGRPAAWTPSDAYFVSLAPRMLGVMHPANRQAVSRWVSDAASSASAVPAYLTQAAGGVSGQTPIVLAIDLKGAVRPHNLDAALRDFELTRNDPAKQKAWSAILMGLQGVTLRVSLTEKARGALRVDFAGSAGALGNEAKPLVLEALNKYGVGIEELNAWQATVQGNAILLEGELSESAMRRIFSLLELPSAKFSELKDAEPAPNSPDARGKASQEYFQSVTTLLDDLRKEFQTNRDARSTMAPVYLERYARKIDRLPILNVDEELLAFGGSVGATLRDASVAAKSGGIRAGARKSQVYGAYSYDYGDNGYYASARPTTSVNSQIDREEQGQARLVRFDSWKQIEDGLADMRKKMTAKYQMEF